MSFYIGGVGHVIGQVTSLLLVVCNHVIGQETSLLLVVGNHVIDFFIGCG